MSNLLFWAALGVLVLYPGTGLSATPDDSPALTEDNVAQFFDTAFRVQQQDHEMVGAVVSVVHQGEVLFKRGYGWADLEQRTPADPDRSLFRIASITKTFVWTAIMQLYEQGRLDIEDDVNDHLDFKVPDTFPEPIRIRHLLTHTPGFEEKNTGSSARSIEEVSPLREHLVSAMPARVRPAGEHASYSNYGTALAGFIIEQITGQTWADYVDEHVLLPLAMDSTNTQLQLPSAFQERHAVSYKYSSGAFKPSPFEYFKDIPAGHMSTTADDMTRFMLAHLNQGEYQGVRILNSDTARKMQQPLFAPHEGIAPMLHGFYRSDRNGLIIFGHGGDVNQFHSNLTLIPSEQLGIFVSFNTDPSSAARSNLIAAFLNRFFPVDYLRAAPEPFDLDLDEYAGEYIGLRSNYSTFERLSMLVNNLQISVQDQELLVGSGSVSRWTATAPDRFVARYADRTMVFERNAAGEISHMVVGSPLGSYQRVRGLDAPSNVRLVMVGTILIAFAAFLGYGYRAFRPGSVAARLPRHHVFVGWLFSFLLLGLYFQLVQTLTGNVDEFGYGVPLATHINLLMMNLNMLIGAAVVLFSMRQWSSGSGGLLARIRYSILAVAVIGSTWVAYYFNFIAYLFSNF